MALKKTLPEIVEFAQEIDGIIKDVVSDAKAMEELYDELTTELQEAKELAPQLGPAIEFRVANDAAVKQRQQALLQRIGELGRRIQASDNPMLVANLNLERSGLYMQLGNTYNDLVPMVISFTQAEVDELRTLLQQAELDAARRQSKADVLNAAVRLAEFTLKLAGKLVT